MRKFAIDKEAVAKEAQDDDWDTDADFVNNVSEKEQRWGSKTVEGSGRKDAVKMDDVRAAVKTDTAAQEKKNDFAYGYGGKFGVQTDRVDASAKGWGEATEKSAHSSTTDYKKGFGGQHGVASTFTKDDEKPAKPTPAPKVTDFTGIKATDAKARFEQMQQQNKEAARLEAEKLKNQRNAEDAARAEEERKRVEAQEKAAAEADKAEKEKAAAAKAAAAQLAASKAAETAKAAPPQLPKKEPEPEPEPEPEAEAQPEPEPEPEAEPEPQAEPEAEAEAEPQAEEQAAAEPEWGQASTGLRARGLYEYTAAGDDEVGFNVDDIIEDIEQIDEGWWRGSCNGHRGLFPANHVELI